MLIRAQHELFLTIFIVCEAFMNGRCPLGNSCPDKHPAKSTQYNKCAPRRRTSQLPANFLTLA